MRDLALLIVAADAAGAADGRSGTPTAAGPFAAPHPGQGAATPVPHLVPDLPALARALGAARVLFGFGPEGEALCAAGWRPATGPGSAPAAEVVAAAAGQLQALLAHPGMLAGFRGDLLVLPVGAGMPPAALLAALRELHWVEGNAATLLTAGAGPAGALVVRRDALGRVSELAEAGLPDPEDGGAREVCGGTMVFRWPALLEVARARAAGATDAPGTLVPAVGWLRVAGAAVGSHRAPETPGACPRCREQPRPSEESGVLIVTARACLAVERLGFNSGQLACYPRRHVTCALSLEPEERRELADLLREGEGLLRRVYDFDALNVGLASGTGSHLAVQLIPRWIGDLNFLPLVSGFKAVPESHRTAYRRLREVLA